MTRFLATLLGLALATTAPGVQARVPQSLVKSLLRDDPSRNGSTYALLVAGSSGYMNYRHQADVCHAYQILKSHGIDDDHVVTMMYDDIAESWRNPKKGLIFNEPGGPDVYHGVKKDYTKGDVTPKNFLAALQGLQTATSRNGANGGGRVLETTRDDDIFVYFADHGGGGILGFPNIAGIIPQSLHEADLEKTIKAMHAAGKYRRMIFYVEACFSGSMFADWLPRGNNSLDLYVVTAATPYESSYACYDDDTVHTYLGDCFSNHWMEDDDNFTASFDQRTFAQQFEAIRNNTSTSTVCQYGDVDLAASTLAQFESAAAAGPNASSSSARSAGSRRAARGKSTHTPVRAEDVTLALAERYGSSADVVRVRKQRQKTDELAMRIVGAVRAMGTRDAAGSGAEEEGAPPPQCQGHPNELACWQRCGTERRSLDECAKLCCGESPPFFPSSCLSSGNGRGGMNCFMECCGETGQETMIDACANKTSEQRDHCTKQCCGPKICTSAAGPSALSSPSRAARRLRVTECYKDFLEVLSRTCPTFLSTDYAMITYSHLVRSMCRSGAVRPSSPAMASTLEQACRGA